MSAKNAATWPARKPLAPRDLRSRGWLHAPGKKDLVRASKLWTLPSPLDPRASTADTKRMTLNLKPSDWVLLTIDASPAKSLSPVQLQKALFLFSRNLDDGQRQTDDFYQFEPYDYGPFDRTVYDDAEALERLGDVVIDSPHSTGRRRYSATPSGTERAASIRESLNSEAREYLDRVVGWVTRLTFNGLVKAIYQEYPEMRANSVFQD